jgi:hypothetical protein
MTTKRNAVRTAYDWHGGMMSPLYSFASCGGVIHSEEHRQRLIEEVSKNIRWAEKWIADRAVDGLSAAEYRGEPHRLHRLLEFIKGAMSEEQRDLVEHFILGEQPTTCPHCGMRTDFTEHHSFQHHRCAACDFQFIWTEN